MCWIKNNNLGRLFLRDELMEGHSLNDMLTR
jgi:hypothetical protein